VASTIIAVLGYSARGDTGLNPICAGRLRRAEELAGPEDAVVLSGRGRGPAGSEAELMAAAWRGPEATLIVDTRPRSTVANARSVVAHAREVRAVGLVVVTSSWHRVRAAALVRAAARGSGLAVSVVPAPQAPPLRAFLREAALLLLLPLQLVAARR
jgi:uncharacterized SAM-binding protein YcdF (DUF218 family)